MPKYGESRAMAGHWRLLPNSFLNCAIPRTGETCTASVWWKKKQWNRNRRHRCLLSPKSTVSIKNGYLKMVSDITRTKGNMCALELYSNGVYEQFLIKLE